MLSTVPSSRPFHHRISADLVCTSAVTIMDTFRTLPCQSKTWKGPISHASLRHVCRSATAVPLYRSVTGRTPGVVTPHLWLLHVGSNACLLSWRSEESRSLPTSHRAVDVSCRSKPCNCRRCQGTSSAGIYQHIGNSS